MTKQTTNLSYIIPNVQKLIRSPEYDSSFSFVLSDVKKNMEFPLPLLNTLFYFT